MNQATFDALVRRLEAKATSSPGKYRMMLTAYALLGYAYLGTMLLIVAAILLGMVALAIMGKGAALLFKVIVPLAYFAYSIVQAMWIKMMPPEGERLHRSQYPKLFEAIDDIRREVNAPEADEVVLTSDFNAAVVQLPRLGIFGWHRNYLVLGLPLMQMLPLEEFNAVVAHEFGHLSGSHGKFGTWIYRLRLGWSQIAERMKQQRSWGRFLFLPFFNWFAPRFAAMSFAQARGQEYEADELAAAACGAGPMANALIRLDLADAKLTKEYWPNVYSRAESSPLPDATPFSSLSRADARQFRSVAESDLQQSLTLKTGTSDTHPCLTERLAAIGQAARIPPVPERSAAEALLGDDLAQFTGQLDREWKAAVRESWSARHRELAGERKQYEELNERPFESLDDDSLWQLAQLREQFEEPAASRELLELLLERVPQHPAAEFSLGRLLLQAGDDRGIERLEQLMQREPRAAQAGCELIVGYLRHHGRNEEEAPYIDRAHEGAEHLEKVEQERTTFSGKETYLPSGLDADALENLRQVLERSPKIKRAYLARKQLQLSSEPVYVLGLVRKGRFFSFNATKGDQKLIDSVLEGLQFSGECYVMVLSRDNQKLKRTLKKSVPPLI